MSIPQTKTEPTKKLKLGAVSCAAESSELLFSESEGVYALILSRSNTSANITGDRCLFLPLLAIHEQLLNHP